MADISQQEAVQIDGLATLKDGRRQVTGLRFEDKYRVQVLNDRLVVFGSGSDFKPVQNPAVVLQGVVAALNKGDYAVGRVGQLGDEQPVDIRGFIKTLNDEIKQLSAKSMMTPR
jgi:hypothetical protein